MCSGVCQPKTERPRFKNAAANSHEMKRCRLGFGLFKVEEAATWRESNVSCVLMALCSEFQPEKIIFFGYLSSQILLYREMRYWLSFVIRLDLIVKLLDFDGSMGQSAAGRGISWRAFVIESAISLCWHPLRAF